MARRVSSQQLIGRSVEIGLLRESLQGLGGEMLPRSRFILIGGEAGVGKTRLVHEMAVMAAEQDVSVVIGHCIENGAQVMPLGPLTEIVQSIRTGPAGGSDPAEPLVEAMDAGVEPARLFHMAMRLIETCAEHRPLVVVFEDLHWADDSTRDLINVLGHGVAPQAPLLMVGTYRSDELHRRHPLLPFLAKLERSASPERMELKALNRDEVRTLATEISGTAPQDAALDELYTRAGGNPFLTEELLAAGAGETSIPDSLRQVVLAQCLELRPDALATIEASSLLSPPIQDRVLQATTGLGSEEHALAIDALAEAGLLVTYADGFGFRHELVREVIADELLPGERSQLHRAAANALSKHDPDRIGQIARHRLEAAELAAALEALVAAGDQALAMGAAAEAAGHFGKALDIWDRVADAESLSARRHGDLLRSAARASKLSRRFDAAVELGRQAAVELGRTDPVAAGGAWYELADYMWNANAPGYDDALERARRLIPDEPPSSLSARIDSAQAFRMNVLGNTDKGIELARRAMASARSVGDYAVATSALSREASCYAERGDDRLLDELRIAIEEAAHTGGDYAEIGRAAGNLMHCLLMLGRHQEAPEVLEQWIEPVIEHGLGATTGALMRFNGVEGYEAIGEWDRAEEIVRAMYATHDEASIRRWSSGLIQGWGHILLARGDYDDGARMTASGIEEYRQGYYSGSHGGMLTTQIELAARGAMPPVSDEEIAERIELALPDEAVEVARAVAAACRFRLDRYSEPGAYETTRRWISMVEETVHEHWVATPMNLTLWLDQARAELASTAGEIPNPGWEALAAGWRELHRPYPEAYALYRAAEAALRSSPGRSRETRDSATDSLRRSRSIAKGLRAAPLVADIDDLARRARLDLTAVPTEDPVEPDPFGLTKREREVLELVAQGQSNGDIGDALFISRKTASVHVSNILRKLEANNRIEAASIARAEGVVN